MLSKAIITEVEFLLNQRNYALSDKHLNRAFELLEILYEHAQSRPTLIYKKGSIGETSFLRGETLKDKFDLIEYDGDRPPQVIR